MPGGIFDSFTVPPAYWTVMLVETVIAEVLVVSCYGSKTPTRHVGFHGLLSRRAAS